MDEPSFGVRRKWIRGHGTADEAPFFAILQRESTICTKVIPDAKHRPCCLSYPGEGGA